MKIARGLKQRPRPESPTTPGRQPQLTLGAASDPRVGLGQSPVTIVYSDLVWPQPRSPARPDCWCCGWARRSTKPTSSPRSRDARPLRDHRQARPRLSASARRDPDQCVDAEQVHPTRSGTTPGRHGPGWSSDVEVAEVAFTAFTRKAKKKQVIARLIVRRIPNVNSANQASDQGCLVRPLGEPASPSWLVWLDNRGQARKDTVQIVAMDPWASYRAAVRLAWPHARIVADHFHLVRLGQSTRH